jgi:hypothetical protein
MNDVFVSYARADRARVAQVVAGLERRGFSVFWDREIPPGKAWDDVLEQHLSTARCVLVLWSKHSAISDWVRTEAAEGKRLHALVPALLDDVAPPLEFRRVQAARLVDWSGQDDDPEFSRIVQAVSSLVGRAAPAPVPPAPTTRRRWVVAAAALTGLAIALIVGAWLLRPRPAPRLQLATADGACPPGLPGTRLTARLGHEPAVVSTIDAQCGVPLPAGAAEDRLDQLDLTLAPDATVLIGPPGSWKIPKNFPAAPLQIEVVDKAATPRVEIVLLPYSGLGTEGARKSAFDEFRGILEDKLTNLVQELSTGPELAGKVAAQQLARLRVGTLQGTGSAAPGTGSGGGLDLEQKLLLWRQRHSLGLLSGTLSDASPTDRARFRVNSQIFIGDLDGAKLGRSIPLAMEIGPDEFRNTRDVHALTVLYALALDARRLEYPDEVVTAYLSKAYSIAGTLQGSATAGALPDSVATVARNVEAELSELAARSRRP